MPDISVVIPLYNREDYITRAVNSVLAQTYKNFEIIVVDDGSSDDSLAVVEKIHDKRIKVIHQENRGDTLARNAGIRESTADHVAFLDSDDEWTPQFLETVKGLEERYPDAGAYCTSMRFVKPDGTNSLANSKTLPGPPWDGIIPRYFHNAALDGPTMTCSSTCLPRKIIDEFDMFPEGPGFGRDNDFFGRVALRHKIAFSWTCGAIIHVEASGRISDINLRKRNINYPLFMKTGKEAIDHGMVSGQELTDLEEYLSFLEISVAYRKLYSGKNIDAMKTVLKIHPYILINKWLPLLAFSALPSKVFLYLISRYRDIMYKT
jgi:glycosyltransferase involved in cell wall biosynthesis